MMTMGFIQNIGPTEIGLLCLAVFLLFGPKQLPKLARSVGETIKEFRGAGKLISEELTKPEDEKKDEHQ